MKCPKCGKEGYRFLSQKQYSKEINKWIRDSSKRVCLKCGHTEE